jgi:DNA-binding response OmpR family regulator
MKVVVYSHDADTRARIRLAIGRRPAPDVPEAEIVEVATQPALFRLLDSGEVDVMVLDGEAQPAGGMGVCRQAKDEIYDCPPVLLVIGRRDDGWLATWSGAEAVVSHPVDPRALASALAGLMRMRAGREAPAGQADPVHPAAPGGQAAPAHPAAPAPPAAPAQA